MKKKQVKHFVPSKDKDDHSNGVPACHCFDHLSVKNIPALDYLGEVAKTRRGVTCGRCQETRIFRGLK